MNKSMLFLLVSIMGVQHCLAKEDVQQKTSVRTQDKTNKQKNMEKILNLTFNKDVTLNTMQANFQQVIRSFESQIPQEYLSEMKKATQTFFQGVTEELLSEEAFKQMINLYDEIYTEKEIEELLKFYDSEIGRKNIQKLPEITLKMTSLSKTVLEKHMPRYIAEVSAIQTKIAAAPKKQ